MIVYTCNGFNDLMCLTMLWNVRHRWLEGERFALNCYKHWVQLLLHQPGLAPSIIIIREEFTQGNLLSMFLYGITLAPLVEDLQAADMLLLTTFYTDYAVFNSMYGHSTQHTGLNINLVQHLD